MEQSLSFPVVNSAYLGQQGWGGDLVSQYFGFLTSVTLSPQMKLKLVHIVSYGNSLLTPYMGKWKKISKKIMNSDICI